MDFSEKRVFAEDVPQDLGGDADAVTDADTSKRLEVQSELTLTPASELNQRVLKKILRVLDKEPDANLTEIIPSSYLARWQERRKAVKEEPSAVNKLVKLVEKQPYDGLSTLLRPHIPTGTVEVIHPLSSNVSSALSPTSLIADGVSCAALCSLIQSSEIMFCSQGGGHRYVVRCGKGIVLKVTPVDSDRPRDFTEYTTLQYLAQHKPDFPAPRVHGLLLSDNHVFLFMSEIQGDTLEKAWSSMSESQKVSISARVDDLLADLYCIEFPSDGRLGGVDGEGCKDVRRSVRWADRPIYTNAEFWDSMYGNPRGADSVYVRALQQFSSSPEAQNIVFVHGDVRPANIIVRTGLDGEYEVAGLIDWEMAGFYPESVECIRATNNLSYATTDDWYLYLPSRASPRKHWKSWLTNSKWDNFVVV